ncbi:MAG: DMT family transporter [Bradyrhizobiaceae bacterium]|nr:DMT family transporter [Bradyrhizobiaceae bacterium]
MNPFLGILLCVLSTIGFTLMGAMVRYIGDRVPVGELVFARNFVVLATLALVLGVRGKLIDAFRTKNFRGHLFRSFANIASIFCNFSGLARIPLAEATAIGFATPLFTVVLAATFLGETVRLWRWSAVLVGFVGVLVMLSPHFGGAAHGTQAAFGAVLVLISALLIAVVTAQIRHLSKTETTPTLLLYYSLFATIASLGTLYWGWVLPSPGDFLALVSIGVFGGMAQTLITESLRYAPASVVAPFGYASMLWSTLIGYVWLGELPAAIVFAGAALVIGSGLFVIWREHQLGLGRTRAKETPAPPVGPPVG